ncbi:MAG: protein translocase subunit SecD [Acetatifactor sp.]|nr:protein translocase subunit SecD [Acetatifactor sp.]
MKKNRAILILLCILVILAGVTYVDIFGVNAAGDGNAEDIKLGLDLAGGVSITYQVVGEESPSSTDMSDTIYKLQQRVVGYSTEAIVYQEGSDRINIEIPGVSNANAILKELGRPGALYFIAQKDSEGNNNYEYYGTDASGNPKYVLNKTIDELMADGSIVITGTDVANAQAGTERDNTTGNSQYVVSLTLTEAGTKAFADATRRALAATPRQSIAIYYDGEFVSVPNVSAVITDGNAIITGQRTFEEAERLASTIRIGGLKLELEQLHSKVVGAQLGVDAINTSLLAGAIGLVLVALFMIAVYRLPGVASVVGLLSYVALVILLLNGFNMTLTLSGIAGIILSIGMAVDANVIIFARIREELAAGKTVRNAIQSGFSKAFSAIIDGNITTLIAAIVLLLLGPGSVKGFAQTLALGIVLSMFTSLVVSRYVLIAFYELGAKSMKLYGVAKEHKPLSILPKKGIFFGVSIAVIAAGFIVMGVYSAKTGDALNFSLDFKGGTAVTVTFDHAMTLEEANRDVVPLIEEITGSAVQVQTVQESNQVIFKMDTLDDEKNEAMLQMFINNFGIDRETIDAETISSTISDEMKSDTIIAVLVAIVCMLIYIRIRFKDIRFGVSSVLALLHDVLVVLAFYAAARVSVSNTFVACMLTIVGYSINATIVIFDRIRENMVSMTRKDDLKEIVDRSITQTMSRSIYTSLTTFIMVTVLYILGVTSIKDFALPLMVGIVCGTYSSICLAGSLWYIFRMKFQPKKEQQ